MKREELEKLGLTKEQVDSVLDMHHKELDPVNKELETTKNDLTASQEKVKTTEEALKAFDGVDPAALNQKIADLQNDLKQQDDAHKAQIADRDFNDLLKESIATAKGKNAKAITALLDVDTLKASKNQKEDITAALQVLAEAEDSSMLFGEKEAKEVGTGDVPGIVTKGGSANSDAAMRAAMGLPPVKTE